MDWGLRTVGPSCQRHRRDNRSTQRSVLSATIAAGHGEHPLLRFDRGDRVRYRDLAPVADGRETDHEQSPEWLNASDRPPTNVLT